MSRFGGFIVQHRYKVQPSDMEELKGLIEKVFEHADDLGVATYEFWIDDEEAGTVTELYGYDSWSHWRRLAEKPTSSSMDSVYMRLDELIIGGLAAVDTRQWQPQSV